MSLSMSLEQREAFLAAVHIGVVALAEDGCGPLTVPVWYAYEPGGEVVFVTDRDSRKGRLLAEGVRMSLCAQSEELPYKYVSVEGPVVSVEAADVDADIRPIAHRYLGPELGDGYIESTRADGEERAQIVVRMRPQRWYTVDYAKRYADQAGAARV